MNKNKILESIESLEQEGAKAFNQEYLKNDFYSYPQDGECSCGVHKHHVHCIHGGIIQIG